MCGLWVSGRKCGGEASTAVGEVMVETVEGEGLAV